MTLYELLVVLPLCVLVAGMVLELLTTGGRMFADAEDRLDTQAAALITLHNLGRELRATTCSSLTITGSSQGVVSCAFRRNAVTPVRPDDSGSPFVIYWLDTRQQAIDRLEVTKDASFQRLTPVFIAAAVAAEPNPRAVAHFVRDLAFTVTSGDPDGRSSTLFPDASVINPVVTITMAVSKSSRSDLARHDEVYSTSVGMRNSL